MDEILTATQVRKHYGGVAALRDARFDLRAGEVHALIGENGAGKSTLARILAGATRPDSASIRIDGRPVLIAHPTVAQRLGIGIIYQELDLFPNLTVGENIVIGNLRARGDMEQFCRPFLRQVGLAAGIRALAGTLPIGQRQLLAIARALSLNARIILMDEPTSSLVDHDVERLFALIRDLRSQGVAIVYVSHKMDEIFRISDRITVLRDGETIQTLDTAATTPAGIIRLMVGRDLQFSQRPRRTPGDIILQVENLATARLRNVSFDLRRGEVLGIAGLVGSGRSELGAALFAAQALVPAASSPLSPPGRFRIGLVPEDRRLQGLMMNMSVTENATLATLPRFRRWGFLDQAAEAAALTPIAEKLALKCAAPSVPVRTLSGGNQQKVLLARWLLVNPDVLFLDDPARGIDVGAKQDIYRIVDELAASGKGVILVSSELPELLRCADRIAVMNNGRLAAIYDAREATQELIMEAATTGTR